MKWLEISATRDGELRMENAAGDVFVTGYDLPVRCLEPMMDDSLPISARGFRVVVFDVQVVG